MPNDLTSLSARAAVAALRAGEVEPRDLVEAALRRIEAVDGSLNALPTICAERALANAATADRQSALAGLPIAVKDLTDVAGVRTTYGSPIYADNVPERSDIVVERLEERGAVVVAKSNTPEFGAGGADLQRGVRRDPEPVGHEPHVRRVVGRVGGRARQPPGLARDRLRPRRQPAHARVVLLGRGPAAVAGTDRTRPGRAAVRHADGGGADGARRRRRGAHARRDVRTAPRGSARAPRAARAVPLGGAQPRAPARGSPGATTSGSRRSSPRCGRSAGPRSSAWPPPASRWLRRTPTWGRRRRSSTPSAPPGSSPPWGRSTRPTPIATA